MTIPSEKRCFKCGEVKPLSAFYKHPAMSDGHVNKCKECNKKDVTENRKLRQDYYHAYDRVRSEQAHRIEMNRLRSTRYRKEGKFTERNKKYFNKFPNRRAAQIAVSNAVRDGRLLKLPCLECGCVEVEAHHPDYDSPLDVIWLCVKHHKEVHRKYDRLLDVDLLTNTTKGNRWDGVTQ